MLKDKIKKKINFKTGSKIKIAIKIIRTKIDPPLIFDLTNVNIKKIRKTRGDKKKTMSTPIS
jgi:predicted DNA-binding antitoxin AbrB/MazE fold protein